ncbi:hypothetical protein ZWY2020_003773 [Hordeum vulgare]|nr:hypothetical protein ZWY2020_003773 [Hordeum vulgare]
MPVPRSPPGTTGTATQGMATAPPRTSAKTLAAPAAAAASADAPPPGHADGTAIDSLGWQAKDRPLAPRGSCMEAAPPAGRRPLVHLARLWPDGPATSPGCQRGKAKESKASSDGPPHGCNRGVGRQSDSPDLRAVAAQWRRRHKLPTLNSRSYTRDDGQA